MSKEQSKKKNFRRPFAIWRVGDKEIKLKLTTGAQIALEDKYGTSVINLIAEDGGVPKLSTMLDVIKEAAAQFNHGINKDKVVSLFDEWIDEGGSVTEFYTNVYMDVFISSGFFTKEAEESMRETIKE